MKRKPLIRKKERVAINKAYFKAKGHKSMHPNYGKKASDIWKENNPVEAMELAKEIEAMKTRSVLAYQAKKIKVAE